MHQIVQQIEILDQIMQARSWQAAVEIAARACAAAETELALYEEWAEGEQAAERAWEMHGAQFIADLAGDELPF